MIHVRVTEDGALTADLLDVQPTAGTVASDERTYDITEHVVTPAPIAEFNGRPVGPYFDELNLDLTVQFDNLPDIPILTDGLPSPEECEFGLIDYKHPALEDAPEDQIQLVADIRRPRHLQRLVDDFVALRITVQEFVTMSKAYHELYFTGVREL